MLCTRNDVFISKPKFKWRFYCRWLPLSKHSAPPLLSPLPLPTKLASHSFLVILLSFFCFICSYHIIILACLC
jgi:hypothetical protein